MEKQFEPVQRQRQETETQAASKSWLELPVHTYIKVIIIAILFCLLFLQEIRSLFYRWQGDSSWSHGFIIPLFSLYFLHHRKDQILALQTRPNYLGLVFMLLWLFLYALNLAVPSLRVGYAGPLLMIWVLGSIVLFLGGFRLLKLTWLPIVFLIFAVPLPQGYYVRMTMPMQKMAADAATALLNLVGSVEATTLGTMIDVVYKGQRVDPPINVAEACSGMRLLMAFVALGVAMAYLYQRPLWQKLVLLVSTVPIAIICNIVRVVITGFIYVFMSQEYAQGIYHDLLGLAMLPLAFALYGLLDRFMSILFIEEESIAKEDIIVRKR
jgi:exosortase